MTTFTKEKNIDMQFRIIVSTLDQAHKMVTEQIKGQIDGKKSWLRLSGRGVGDVVSIYELEKMKEYLSQIFELQDKVIDFLINDQYDRRDIFHYANYDEEVTFRKKNLEIFALSYSVFEWGLSNFANDQKFEETGEFDEIRLSDIFDKFSKWIKEADELLEYRVNEYYGKYKTIHWNCVMVGQAQLKA